MSNESGKKPVLHKKHIARLERERRETRLILYTFFGILGAVVLLLFYGWLDINYLQSNRAVAKVGDTKILVKDFEPRVRLQRQQLLDNYYQYQQYAQYFGMDVSSQLQDIQNQLDFPSVIGQAVLDIMINEEIIRQEAAKRGITVSAEEIDAEMQSGFGYFPNGTPTATVTPTEPVIVNHPFDVPAMTFTPDPNATATLTLTPLPTETATLAPTESPTANPDGTIEPTATFTEAPTATATIEPTVTPTQGPTSTPLPTATPYTYDGYQKVVSDTAESLSKFGLDDAYIRRYFETQLLTKKLEEDITADVVPEDEQIHARHILVSTYSEAMDIIGYLKDGVDFELLANELSLDTGSAQKGGDLGWFGKGQMVPEFEAAAFALQNPGDFTDKPIQSSFGYHIIQLIDRSYTPEQLQTAKDNAFKDWLNTARDEYSVEIFDIWQQRVPTEPNFTTSATESAAAGQTAQAEQVATLQAGNATETPTP